MTSRFLTNSIPDQGFFWSIGDILCTSGASVLLFLTSAGCHFSFDGSHSFPLPLHFRFIDLCLPDAFTLFRRRWWACSARRSGDVSPVAMLADQSASLIVRVVCNVPSEQYLPKERPNSLMATFVKLVRYLSVEH